MKPICRRCYYDDYICFVTNILNTKLVTRRTAFEEGWVMAENIFKPINDGNHSMEPGKIFRSSK